MTSRLRTLLAWLLLSAIPLQGLAAASMLYCGPAATAAVRGQTAHHEVHQGHEGHQAHEGHTADTATSAPLPDSGHKCGICAACCHSVAIAPTSPMALLSGPAQSTWDEPFMAVHTRPSPVPDKPPRG